MDEEKKPHSADKGAETIRRAQERGNTMQRFYAMVKQYEGSKIIQQLLEDRQLSGVYEKFRASEQELESIEHAKNSLKRRMDTLHYRKNLAEIPNDEKEKTDGYRHVPVPEALDKRIAEQDKQVMEHMRPLQEQMERYYNEKDESWNETYESFLKLFHSKTGTVKIIEGREIGALERAYLNKKREQKESEIDYIDYDTKENIEKTKHALASSGQYSKLRGEFEDYVISKLKTANDSQLNALLEAYTYVANSDIRYSPYLLTHSEVSMQDRVDRSSSFWDWKNKIPIDRNDAERLDRELAEINTHIANDINRQELGKRMLPGKIFRAIREGNSEPESAKDLTKKAIAFMQESPDLQIFPEIKQYFIPALTLTIPGMDALSEKFPETKRSEVMEKPSVSLPQRPPDSPQLPKEDLDKAPSFGNN